MKKKQTILIIGLVAVVIAAIVIAVCLTVLKPKKPIHTEHNYIAKVIEPTCTEQGYTLHTCDCGDSFKDNFVDALGHTEVTDQAVSATCTTDGKTEGSHCDVCVRY